MIFLGTAAAECIPSPFCDCDICKEARASIDPKMKKRRSTLLLDEKNLIDFGPDLMGACLDFNVSLTSLEQVFVTHMHEDHFDYWNLAFKLMAQSPQKPITLYMSKKAYAGICSVLAAFKKSGLQQVEEQVRDTEAFHSFVAIDHGETIKAGEWQVTALKGNHMGFFKEEYSLNYLFEKDGKKMFYACDTGVPFEETYLALAGCAMDQLVIEGSFGITELPPTAGHLWYGSLCTALDRMILDKAITEKTKIYVTHLAHKGKINPHDYERLLQERYGSRLLVAYDGMKVE